MTKEERRRFVGYSEEEILAMEISEDRRLREMGIDPEGDPIDIMMEVRRRVKQRRKAQAERTQGNE